MRVAPGLESSEARLGGHRDGWRTQKAGFGELKGGTDSGTDLIDPSGIYRKKAND